MLQKIKIKLKIHLSDMLQKIQLEAESIRGHIRSSAERFKNSSSNENRAKVHRSMTLNLIQVNLNQVELFELFNLVYC